MKKNITFLCLFLLVSIEIHAEVYVKGILHINGGYRYGHDVPDMDVVYEWWFGKNKVTLIITGWGLDFVNTDWRFTLNKERQHIFAANLSEKSIVEIPLPMNLLSHVDQPYAEWLNIFQIYGTVKKTGEKKTVIQKKCDVYEVSEWIIQGEDRFYERDRTVLATSDVPFDWQIVNELYQWIRSFFNPQQSYLSELEKMEGFIMSENDDLFELGSHVSWSFKVLEISQKDAPENIYGIPRDFQKKEKFSVMDLINMRGMLYVRPLY